MNFLYWLESIRTPVGDFIANNVTLLGGETVFIIATLILFWCVDKKRGLYMLTVGMFGTAINQFLKLFFHIPRPWVKDPYFTIVESAREGATGYSFPSGHTQNAWSIFGVLARTSSKFKWIIINIVILVLICFSRMYLGVHTPLDVGVSCVIGLILILVLYPFFNGEKASDKVIQYILIGLTVCSLLLVLYVEFIADKSILDEVNYTSGLKQAYTLLGTNLGMCIAFYFDSHYINFKTKAVVWAQIVKVVVGLVGVLLIKGLLKQPLNMLFAGHQVSNAVRYFLVLIFAGCIYPLTFNWFSNREKLGRKGKRHIKQLGVVVGVFVLLLGGLVVAVRQKTSDEIVKYDTTNPFITQEGKTLLSAHRSGGGITPENTMMAFEYCTQHENWDIDVYEFDLHLTKDNVLVLLHDETLDRTSNAIEYFGHDNIKPSDYTYQELRELNMGENFKTYDGEFPYRGLRGKDIPENLRIASLEEVLTYLTKNKNVSFIIEIKEDAQQGFLGADLLYKTITKLDCVNNTIVGSFHDDVLEYIDKEYPSMLRGAGTMETLQFYLNAMFGKEPKEGSYPFNAVQLPIAFSEYVVDFGNTKIVNYAHKHNIAAQYWTINDKDDMKYLKNITADAIMTDYPDIGMEVLK